MNYRNRHDAGKRLAMQLKEYEKDPDAVVIALPRGGVVVGYEVANALHLPLDITCPRKIGAPFNPEFAIGAITENGDGVFSTELVNELHISKEFIDTTVDREKKEAKRRLDQYRKGRPALNLTAKNVIVVDDGLATGSTMRAAIKTIKSKNPKKVIMAVPVAPADTIAKIEKEVDKVICLLVPQFFYAVGQFYEFFEATDDDEVIDLLDRQYIQTP